MIREIEWLLHSIIASLFAISIHEYAHGIVAYKLGDPTPNALGRLSLNPLRHLDPVGIIMLVIFKVGWAKPVQINPLYFKNRKSSVIFVALAGPLANLIVAWTADKLIYVVAHMPLAYGIARSLIILLIITTELNLILAAFNLIPLPPLDGSRIVANLLPLKARMTYESLSKWAPLILILGVWTDVLDYVLYPIVHVLRLIVYSFTI